MKKIEPVGYIVGDQGGEVTWFDEPIFGCTEGEDVGPSCCIVQSCCCAGWAHAKAVGWANKELGDFAEKAFYSELVANALRSAANNNGGQPNVVLDVLATGQEIRADLQYAGVRRRLINLMFGVWEKEKGQLFLRWSPATNPCEECLIQVCCSPCARCQETSSLMKWRRRVTGFPVRYSVLNCAFEELQPGGYWSTSVRGIPPSKQLQGDNLLGRKGPIQYVPAPVPMVALRM